MTYPVRSSYDDYWTRLEKRLQLAGQSGNKPTPNDSTSDTAEDDYSEKSLP